MLKRFLPQQENFFTLFKKIGDHIVATATEYSNMMHDLQNQQKYVDTIAHHEMIADEVAHEAFALLHKTFITPFDRHDIHQLISKLDDILDLMNRCAQRFPFYELNVVPQEITRLAELSLQAALSLNEVLSRLNSLDKAEEIFRICHEIENIESDAHRMVLAGEKNLFLNETHFKQFFKLKEIYAKTKLVIDGCQDAANAIKGIVLEYS